MTTTIFIIIGVIIIGVAGWYLLSSIFIEKKVDEKFPETAQTPTFRVPSPEELERMTENMIEGEREEMRKEIMEEMKNVPDTVMEEMMPSGDSAQSESASAPAQNAEPARLSSGVFQGADSFHQGFGSAGTYRLADGSHILRFEDFSVTNGPDLRVLLAKNRNPRESVELAPLKGNRGNQNYAIPSNVNLSDYNSVIIYCKPFRVVFATVQLQ